MATPTPKSAPRFTRYEWEDNLKRINALAETKREISRQVRNEGALISTKLRVENAWQQRRSFFYLSARLEHLWQWKCKLERTLDDVYREIDAVRRAKEHVEKVIEEQVIPDEVNRFCLVTRDRRQNAELVTDEVQRALIEENKIIGTTNELLNDKAHQLFDGLCRLGEIKDKLEMSIDNQRKKLDLEKEQIELDMKGEKTSLKPTVLRRVVIEEDEEDKRTRETESLIKDAEDEIEAMRRQREISMEIINEREEERYKQKVDVDYEYRKRIHRMKQAIDQINWNKKNLEDEVYEMQKNIELLEVRERETKRPAKLTETRLELRRAPEDTNVPFVDERNLIECTKKKLNEMLSEYREKSNDCRDAIRLMDEDLTDKIKAIQMEQQCEQERTKMTSQISQRDIYTMPPVVKGRYISQREITPLIDDGRWQLATINYFD